MKLFTNLSYITVREQGGERGVRTTSHALLVEPHRPLGVDRGAEPTEWKLRGFGTEAAWQVFDLLIPSPAFVSQDWEGNSVLLREDGSQTPIASGITLEFDGGPALALWVEDQSRPVALDEFDDGAYLECWAKLEDRVADFWTAPAMPFLAHESPTNVAVTRGLLRERQAAAAMGRRS